MAQRPSPFRRQGRIKKHHAISADFRHNLDFVEIGHGSDGGNSYECVISQLDCQTLFYIKKKKQIK